MKILRIALIFMILALIVSACSGDGSTSKHDLEGITWVLKNLNKSSPLDNAQPTIEFDEGQVSGNASCNHYGGSYIIKSDTISFSDLYNTEMACMEPEGAMEQEQVYLEILRDAKSYNVVEGVLTIFASTGQILTFEKQ